MLVACSVRTVGSGRERETFPVPYTGNGSKNSKWWSSSLSFIAKSWAGGMRVEQYKWSTIMGRGG
jgi:hypothetical protein